MEKKIKLVIALAIVTTLCLGNPLAFAAKKGDMPKGFAKGEKKGWSGEATPPGWNKGTKTGWQGKTTPPGLPGNVTAGNETAG